jgi:peptidoglycan/LPS O-acetylase OafA/YrhL
LVTSPTIEIPVAQQPSARPASRDTYRPHLDGLRAIAVYLVVLFHAGSSWFSGGYIGVDVFFVLSGYLVTQVLLRDIGPLRSISYARFYARRYRRLLPAAFVTLLVTAVVYKALASPAEVASSVNAFKAAFLYVANWFFIRRSTAYFGGDITQNPVLQFWSLAVEEQFYLLWPLLLAGVIAWTRKFGTRQFTVARTTIMIAAAASLGWALWLRTSNPVHAYYGTDTRAYQLLAGALIALTPSLVSRPARSPRAARLLVTLSLVVLVALALSSVHLDAVERGVAAMVTTVGVIIGLEAAKGGVFKRVLSSDSVVYLGKVSYGTYLWHWPVIFVMTATLHLSTLSTVVLSCFIATSIASLSFTLLEHPVRVSHFLDRHRRAVVAAGLAISIASAVVLIPAIFHRTSPSSAAALSGTRATPVPKGLDFADATFSAIPRPPTCVGRPPSDCTIVRGTGKHVLLMGDSHAQMLIPTFTDIARRENLTLSVLALGACPWQRHVYLAVRPDECRRRKEDFYKRVIPALRPDVVIAINYGFDDTSVGSFAGVARGETGPGVYRGQPEFRTLMTNATRQSAAALTAGGAKLIIVEPIPIARTNPTACLVRTHLIEPCRYVAPNGPTVLEPFYRQLAAENHDIYSANFDRIVCPFLPICDPVIAGHIVKVDADHLTVEFANYIAPAVDAYLKDQGIIG